MCNFINYKGGPCSLIKPQGRLVKFILFTLTLFGLTLTERKICVLFSKAEDVFVILQITGEIREIFVKPQASRDVSEIYPKGIDFNKKS